MQYTKEDFVDKSDIDENGQYEYYYEYTLYYFNINNIVYVFRSYKDTPGEVNFLRLEKDGDILNSKDVEKAGLYRSEVFMDIIKTLRDEEGLRLVKN